MATLKQIEANRRNALKSTGPRTHEGKAASRMNSLRHGLRAGVVVLPGENQEHFDQLCLDLEEEWRPQSLTEQIYVEQMAVAQWKLARCEVAEANVLRQDLAAPVQIPLLDRIWQNQRRLERSFSQAHRELERLQKARRHAPLQSKAEPSPAPRPAAVEPLFVADDPRAAVFVRSTAAGGAPA
ncbi:MAG TPA: hypothetical protein VL285_08890 [Bryobacteraceae bacterium]|nr:hypothetical protein [Bryobacteraceae bacterium]